MSAPLAAEYIQYMQTVAVDILYFPLHAEFPSAEQRYRSGSKTFSHKRNDLEYNSLTYHKPVDAV